MITPILFFAAFLGLIAYVNILAFERRGEWHEDPYHFRMRRKVAGKWQYRPMTHSEEVDAVDRNAW